MSIELKIKSKSLQEEARIIRKMENKLLKKISEREARQKKADNFRSQYLSIQWHRKWDVRNEARRTFLARAFMKGYKYSDIEGSFIDRSAHSQSVLNHWAESIATMVKKYGSTVEQRRHTNAETIQEWFNT